MPEIGRRRAFPPKSLFVIVAGQPIRKLYHGVILNIDVGRHIERGADAVEFVEPGIDRTAPNRLAEINIFGCGAGPVPIEPEMPFP